MSFLGAGAVGRVIASCKTGTWVGVCWYGAEAGSVSAWGRATIGGWTWGGMYSDGSGSSAEIKYRRIGADLCGNRTDIAPKNATKNIWHNAPIPKYKSLPRVSLTRISCKRTGACG